MNIVGPTRLVLIHAGIYDYGEVEMSSPLHLIGPNNVGKTSLIATLQFLYIDDQRHMHFSRNMADTRRYYFPDINSYVLFECLTPTGFQVFGVHGLGPLKQYDIQRFSYQGRFDRADFLDDQRRIRDADDIRASLSTKTYTLLEPRHLRAALTGMGDTRDVHLGLLPLRHRGHYTRFRAVFRNLLRLAHLRQEELKEFLIEIHAGEFQQRSIDLERDYSGQYEKVRRGAHELRDLQVIEPEARRLLVLAGRRDQLRRELPGLWDHMMKVYAVEDTQKADDLAAMETLNSKLQEDRDEAEAERIQVQEHRSAVAEKRGALGQRLADLKAQEKAFEGFLTDFENQRLSRLQDQIDDIGSRLKRAHWEPLERLNARIQRNQQQLHDKQALLDRLAHTLAARLGNVIDRSRFDELFGILNPALLGAPAGKEGIEILDERLLEERLRIILENIADGIYSDQAVRIPMSVLPVKDLGVYMEPDQIQERISELSRELERDRADLEAAQNTEQLRSKQTALQKEREQCTRRLLQYEQYQENLARSEEWKTRHEELVQQETQLTERLGELDKQRDQCSEQLQQVDRDMESLKKFRNRRRESIHRLTRPDPDWPAEEVQDLPGELDQLIPRYEDGFREQDTGSRELSNGLSNIKARTYGRFDRETEAETLAALSEELDAIQEKETAVRELWTGLAAGLGNAFKALNRDLDTLKSRVDELNRSLSGVSVSNLARLRLLVKEHPEWVSRIRTVAMDEDMPLFSDRAVVEGALEHLGELLGRYPRVRLMDLFDLNFEVSTPDGIVRKYPHLESIESNGTTITIKVLINLMLLRGLLGSKETSIPFYLDEASSLDHENLMGIVKKSQDLGFVPVLASPDAMDAADNLYFLREHKGRVVLEPQTSLLRIHRDNGDASDTIGSNGADTVHSDRKDSNDD